MRAEHLTTHKAIDFATNYNGVGSATVVNSILVGVTNCSMSHDFSDHTSWHATDVVNVFTNAGVGGRHYLIANSTNRNSAGPNINPVLKDTIQTLTTFPPKVTNGVVWSYAVYGPQAPPDNDGQLDRGYHYPIVDWLINSNGMSMPGSGLVISNASVAIDFSTSGNGFVLDGGGAFGSLGKPLQHNKFYCAPAIHEGPFPAPPSPAAIFRWSGDWSIPNIGFDCTDLIEILPGPYTLLDIGFDWFSFGFSNGEMAGVGIGSSGGSSSVSVNNSVVRGCSFSLTAYDHGEYGPLTASFSQNTLIGCGFSFTDNYYPIWHPDWSDGNDGYGVYQGGNSFNLYNNIFDNCSIDDPSWSGSSYYNPTANSYNGYIGCGGVAQLYNSGGNDVFLDALSYESGPRGKYYLPRQINGSADPLIDASWASAAAFLFFHQTTAAAQDKEKDSICDFGAHFMALAPPTTNDTVWVEDIVPGGATVPADSSVWTWIQGSPAPFSGSSAHQTALASGFHQHYFTNAATPLTILENDKLYCYIYLDSAHLPSEVMLQWLASDDSGWHRAYWGADDITTLGPRNYQGPLPAAGTWYRLEVPANAVDLEGRTINGMAFTLHDGQATWDHAGLLSIVQAKSAADSDGDSIADYVQDLNLDGAVSSGESPWLGPIITITAPADNSSFNTARIDVSATVAHNNPIRLAAVNGVSAFVTASGTPPVTHLTARGVPLISGESLVTATVLDSAGNAGSASITVAAAETLVEPVVLAATPTAGFGPLTVTFSVQANLSGVSHVLYDFDGDGTTDFTANDLTAVSHTYAAGDYLPAVTIQTSAGNFSSSGGFNGSSADRLVISVQPAPIVQTAISVATPVDLKVTSDGNIYVLSQSSPSKITEFNSGGTVLRLLSGAGTSPSGLDVDGSGNVYVAATGDNQILKFTPTSSSFQLDSTFGNSGHIGRDDKAAGSAQAEFSAPYDVAVTADNNSIYISDSGNHRIRKFSKTGTFQTGFGSFGRDMKLQ